MKKLQTQRAINPHHWKTIDIKHPETAFPAFSERKHKSDGINK